jgi:hypothetical protein
MDKICRLGMAVTVLSAGLALSCSDESLAAHATKGPTVLADSVADFALTQGTNHWQYGYLQVNAKNQTFVSLSNVGGSCHGPGWTPPDPSKYWTCISATSMIGNGLNGNQGRLEVEELAIRRWTSPYAGRVYITGTIGGPSGQGGMIEAAIAVDKGIQFTNSQSNTTTTRFSLSMVINKGSVIDFVIAPHNHVDTDNVTPFTVQIMAP